MQITNIHQAKAHLSNLIHRASSGEEVIICKAGIPIARLIKYETPKSQRIAGLWKGKVTISDDFDDLPQTLVKAFNNTDL